MSELQDKLIDSIVNMREEVELRKFDIITEILRDLGYDFNFDVEKKRKFKSLIIEKSEDKEDVYFNDGSVGGLLIASFTEDYKYKGNGVYEYSLGYSVLDK